MEFARCAKLALTNSESYESNQVQSAACTLFDFAETRNPNDLRHNFQREGNACLRIDAYLVANPLEAKAPNIVFLCCRSRWEEDEWFSHQEVALIVT
ncbi:Hypothetical protein PHPALM_14094 [Phytophthora palmivora]|uniref:Uncharacterized protein n=1 Tax=Phytophthora palmivora TaxID=4796 RepID=A0A2P4XVM4_9STRA|nr:Hypothetical protein PHPALM_14094 [Phytophthora palmivora]